MRFLDTALRLADFEIKPDGSFSQMRATCGIPATPVILVDKRHDSQAAVIAALYRTGYEAPLESHYRSRNFGLATLPPVSFASIRTWPEKLP